MRPNTVEAGNLGDRGGRCECRTHSVSYQLSHATLLRNRVYYTIIFPDVNHIFWPGTVSSCYGLFSGDQVKQGLHRTDRLTEQVDPIHLTEGITFVFEKTPIVFDIKHLV